MFADPDAEKAFDAITLSGKVNLAEPDKSQVVLKLKNESHNCWSGDCLADSNTMLEAVRRWAALAPAGSGAGISTDSQPVPPESAARLSQTEYGTLLLQAEQEYYRSSVVSGRFFDLQDSNSLEGKFLSVTPIGDNPHTVAPRSLVINSAAFNSCRDFTAADSSTSPVIRINAPRVHIPSGLTDPNGKVVPDGYRPFTTSLSLQIIRPDKRLEYARMIFNDDFTGAINAVLYNAAPTSVPMVAGTKLPNVFQGTAVQIDANANVLPHFLDWSDVFNSDGSFKTAGSFTRDDGTVAGLYTLFKDGSYSPSSGQLQLNLVKKPVLKRDNFYRIYKNTVSSFFYTNATTRRSPFVYPYSQFVNADVITYFSPVVDVQLQCPATLDCSANSNLLKYHVTQSGTPLTQSNALDCYTLDAAQNNIIPTASSNCTGTNPRFFHYIDLFVRAIVRDSSVKTAETVSYFNSSSPSTFVDWENFSEDTTRRRVFISNQTVQELDPDVFFSGGTSALSAADDLDNFTKTFYQHVRLTRCVDCHGDPVRTAIPQFASSNPATALSALKSGGYINFNTPTSSLRPNGMIHNCNPGSSDPRYSCDPTAEQALRDQFVTSINNWKAANDADAAVSGAIPYRSLTTAERLPGRVKYEFKVTQAGKYNVWMRVRNLNPSSRLNFRIQNISGNDMPFTQGSSTTAGGTCYQWNVSTSPDVWTWSTPGRQDELASIDQRGFVLLDNNKQPLTPPNNRIYFDLPVGNYVLDIIGLTEGIRLDAVGVNRVENFSTDERLMFQPDRRAIDEKNISDYRRNVLRYDISGKLGLANGKQAFFEIEVKKQFSGQNYIFRNPRFITSSPDVRIRFRGIKVYINGNWSFPDATYNALEGVSGDDKVLTYAPLVALTRGQNDLIHFQFDELAVTDQALTPFYPKGSLPAAIEDRRCAQLGFFVRNVKPILFDAKLMLTDNLRAFISAYPGGARNQQGAPRVYNCVTCHTATHPFFKMSTFLNDEEFCREALSRVDFQNFYQSLVIRGINGTGNHPKFVFVERFLNQADNNFKIHDQGQDYVNGFYRTPTGIASQLVPGPMMVWSRADMGISATTFSSLTPLQKTMIAKNGLFRQMQHQTIPTAVETYSWYQPDIHYSLLYNTANMPDRVLTARDVINPDPAFGRLNTNRTEGPRLYDIMTFDSGGIPVAISADPNNSNMIPFKGSVNQTFVPNGPFGFNRSTIDYISTTPATNTEAEMWTDYEVQRDYYREKIIQWIRLENEARLSQP